MELRENGITKPILILGYVDEADMDTIARQHITAPVYDEETAQLLSDAAVRTGEKLTVHYKLDTGMTVWVFPRGSGSGPFSGLRPALRCRVWCPRVFYAFCGIGCAGG